MIKLNNDEKRWLEVIFMLIIHKVYNTNKKENEVFEFINGYRWTNFFDCDILTQTIKDYSLIKNPIKVEPTQYELVKLMTHPNCRLTMKPLAIRELLRGTRYKFYNAQIFKERMVEECKPIETFPKIETKGFHIAVYNFLLALHYIARMIYTIKF